MKFIALFSVILFIFTNARNFGCFSSTVSSLAVTEDEVVSDVVQQDLMAEPTWQTLRNRISSALSGKILSSTEPPGQSECLDLIRKVIEVITSKGIAEGNPKLLTDMEKQCIFYLINNGCENEIPKEFPSSCQNILNREDNGKSDEDDESSGDNSENTSGSYENTSESKENNSSESDENSSKNTEISNNDESNDI